MITSELTELSVEEPPPSKPRRGLLTRWGILRTGSIRKKAGYIAIEQLDLKQTQTVLDIGFGRGYNLVQMARKVGPNGEVYGIDISSRMQRVTLNRLQKQGLTANVVLEVADASQLPFETNFFDALFMGFTLDLIPPNRIPEALNECRRVIKTAAKISIVSLAENQPSGVGYPFFRLAEKIVNYQRSNYPFAAQPWLKQAGFQIQDVQQHKIYGVNIESIVALA